MEIVQHWLIEQIIANQILKRNFRIQFEIT